MEGRDDSAFAASRVSSVGVNSSNKQEQRKAEGELVVEPTDFRKTKNIWQEKLDEAMAKKEQEQILAELQEMRTSEREGERATYQFLKSEGYCVDLKDRQEKYDEMLARQLAEEQERQLQQEQEDAALAAAVASDIPELHESGRQRKEKIEKDDSNSI